MNVKTLLVDDEKIDLEWMRRRVAGSGLPLEVAGTANSGFAALQILQEQPIDLILSDIRMPIMTGMEFARKAKEIHPRVKIVFISGHEDFGYAKEALSLHASGYLLKPVDDDELHGMLAQLCEEIRQERERIESEVEVLSLASQELLLRWLSGRTREPLDGRMQRFLAPLVREGAAAAIVEMDDTEWKLREMPAEERQKLAGEMAKFIGDFAAENGLGTIVASPSDHRLVVLAEGTEEECTVLLEELIRAAAAAFPLTVTAGCGAFTDDWRRLPESYRQAEAAIGAKWLIGKNRLIRDVAEPSPADRTAENLDELVDRMLEAILAYDLVGIDDCLLRIFGRERPLQRMDDVYNLIIRMTSKLHADLRQLDENLYELLEWESHQPAVLFRFETVDDILSWLRRRFFELSEMLFTKRSKPNRKLIDVIIRYVQERIEMKVTLKEVAARFDFSPNYLGHLFKEETGKHFSDLLMDLRMKRVCELLADPSLKIYEIADRVGYKNIIYFNRQFKLWAGMSPGEYRKKHNI
ncbi:response regulator [Cohnella caldifontis]|uniref:response regulator n=1 Tax=Cohnella caldifontis TaxID=3027471 RepID=UPI0023ED4861|nr:response regulator [Cohnella sp. YIM B05605]